MCRVLPRLSEATQPLVPLLIQLWMAVIYYADTVVAGNTLLVQDAVAVYKQELERKKGEMRKRVDDIVDQADKMQRAQKHTLASLKLSVARLSADKQHMDDVLRDRELQIKLLTDTSSMR